MTAPQQQQLARICGNAETISKARELLNLAQTKTGPGSGHNLGSNASALPAICAFLASERLGNNDVSEKIAQQASCINPKAFQTVLNVTRAALAQALIAEKDRSVSYESLARTYGLSSDVMYWIEEVDKELRKNEEELENLEVSEETIIYCVFYWTCIALHIRAVKGNNIVSEYGISLRDFQELQALLDRTCRELHNSIDNHLCSSRTTRSSGASPSKQPPVSPTKTSPLASIRKTRSSLPVDDMTLKRKIPQPALPFVSPLKKARTTSPIKLNRIPVGSSMTHARPGPSSRSLSPVKLNRLPTAASSSGMNEFLATPTRSTRIMKEPPAKLSLGQERDEGPAMPERELSPSKASGVPIKNIGGRLDRLVLADDTLSPLKSARKGGTVREPSTPTPHRGRPSKRASLAAVELNVDGTKDVTEEQASSSSEEEGKEKENKLHCRHRIRPFPDRQFYEYKDPRATREWEVCEKNMNVMLEELGHPFDIKEQVILIS